MMLLHIFKNILFSYIFEIIISNLLDNSASIDENLFKKNFNLTVLIGHNLYNIYFKVIKLNVNTRKRNLK